MNAKCLSTVCGKINDIDPFIGDCDCKPCCDKKNKIVRTYECGKLNGLYEEYDNEGRLTKRTTYLNNKLDGSLLKKVFDNSGNIVLVEKCFYTCGLLNGPCEIKKFNSGKLMTIIKSAYLDSKLDGCYEEVLFDYLGNVVTRIVNTYVLGSLNGPFINDSQTLYVDGNYIDGDLNGLINSYPKNTANVKRFTIYYIMTSKDVISAIDTKNRDMLYDKTKDNIVWIPGKTQFGVYVFIKFQLSNISQITKCIVNTDLLRCDTGTVVDIIDANGVSYPNDNTISLIPNDTNGFVYNTGSTLSSTNYDPDITTLNGDGIYCHKYQDYCNQWFV